MKNMVRKPRFRKNVALVKKTRQKTNAKQFLQNIKVKKKNSDDYINYSAYLERERVCCTL